jgi:hypothetical protein
MNADREFVLRRLADFEIRVGVHLRSSAAHFKKSAQSA